jgi:hypothetical protein
MRLTDLTVSWETRLTPPSVPADQDRPRSHALRLPARPVRTAGPREDLSVIVSSHLLHDLERVCDHIILLAASRTQISDDGLVAATMGIPLLFGVFWGAPLLAREFEDGTHNLAWTQGVTRRRWLSRNLMWALAAASAFRSLSVM